MAVAARSFNKFLNNVSDLIAARLGSDVSKRAMQDRTLISDLSADFDNGHEADEAVSLHIAEVVALYA